MAKKARKSLRDWMTAVLADARRPRVEPKKEGSRARPEQAAGASGSCRNRPRGTGKDRRGRREP
jgi:hypothetical protein